MRILSLCIPLLFTAMALTLSMPIARGSTVFYADTFTLVSDPGTCNWRSYYVYDAAGTLITGSVTVKQPGKIDFYVLNEAQWALWTSVNVKRGTTCAVLRPQKSEVNAYGVTQYAVSYVVPDNTNHTFLFYNSYTDDATVTVSLAW